MVRKLPILLGPHCIMSAYTQGYELKFCTETNFDTLISNLIFNMISLSRHDDVILEKSVKRQALSAQIHIFIDSMSQIILFLVDITLIA